MLVNAGANVNITNDFGIGPLGIAIASANNKLVKILVMKHADMHYE